MAKYNTELFVGPSPCDNCVCATDCATQALACTAFLEFYEKEKWSTAPGSPSSDIYDKIFKRKK